MKSELKLPKQAFLNKFIAKTKFYEQADLSTNLKNDFINKIQRITWLYKLAEQTIGITKTEKVIEIQIFEIELKKQIIPEKALKVIDKSIPYQILYKFIYKDFFAWGITLKESKKVENYYFSKWNEAVSFDFTGIDLEKVYQKLVKTFIDTDNKQKLSFEELVISDNNKKQLKTEITSLENKVKREKQFNRKVEMNKILQEKKTQFKKMTDIK